MSDQAITSIDQLAQALAAEPQDEPAAQPEAEAAEGEPVEPAEEVEGEPEAPVEGEGEEPEEPESLDDKVVSWETASGDKFEVPVAELKNGYMREQDYRHKTQNLAAEREQATKQVQEQFETVQAHAQDFGTLYAIEAQIKALEEAVANTDVNSDPMSVYNAKFQIQELKEHRNGLATRIQGLQQQRAAEQQQRIAEGQQKMIQELSTALPNFGPELVQKLNATAQELGYTQQELAQMTDTRFVKMVNEIHEYRALKAKTPATVNKVKAAPIKPTKQAASAPASAIEQRVKQFSKTKSLANFAALYEQTLKK
jgi:hypothetical protein